MFAILTDHKGFLSYHYSMQFFFFFFFFVYGDFVDTLPCILSFKLESASQLHDINVEKNAEHYHYEVWKLGTG